MTIYFAGSEPDCLTGGTPDSSGTYHDANYVRCAIGALATSAIEVFLPAEVTPGDLWIHGRQQYTAGGHWSEPDHDGVIVAQDTSGNNAFNTVVSDNITSFTIYGTDGSNTSSPAVWTSAHDGRVLVWDVHYYASGSDTKLDVYLNGAAFVSATLAGKTPRSIRKVLLGSASYSFRAYWSEIIVADVDTRNLRVGCYYPSADGTHTDGTGSYADLDEIDTDGNAVTLAAVGDAQSVALTKHGTQPLAGVLAVAVNGLVASDGTNDLQAGLRISGTDYYSADLGVGATPEARSVVFNTHPGTGGNLPQDPSTIEAIWKAVTPT